MIVYGFPSGTAPVLSVPVTKVTDAADSVLPPTPHLCGTSPEQWCIYFLKELANTLRNWLKKGKKHFDKLVQVLKDIALEKDSIVNCDETWCKVRKYDKYKKCYTWVLVNKAEQTVVFFYEDGSRGRDVLVNFLGDAELNSIMSDGYNAYVFIGDELKTTTLKKY